MSVEDAPRGRTSIPAAVIRKVIAQTALDVPYIGADSGGVLGVGARRTFDALPDVDCTLYGQNVAVRLSLGVRFPAPLSDVMRDLRRAIDDAVARHFRLTVTRLDVDITWLHSESKEKVRYE